MFSSGCDGEGILNEIYGDGEYLDAEAIAAAKMHALSSSPRHLPVVRLVLSGFVVDTGPFLQWFDPLQFREIEFRSHCIDAGFALPPRMKNRVTILCPAPTEYREVKMTKVKLADVHVVQTAKKVEKITLQKKKSRRRKAEEKVRPYFSGQPL